MSKGWELRMEFQILILKAKSQNNKKESTKLLSVFHKWKKKKNIFALSVNGLTVVGNSTSTLLTPCMKVMLRIRRNVWDYTANHPAVQHGGTNNCHKEKQGFKSVCSV